MAKSAPKKPRATKRVKRQEEREFRRQRGNVAEIVPGASPEMDEPTRTPPRRLECMTEAQGQYLMTIIKNIATIGDGPAGTGKAQPLDALLKTPSGWITMGSAAIGQLLTMPDGTQAPVTAVYPQGMKDIWRVTFEDGRTAECCDEHLWRVYRYDWQPDSERWRVIPLSEVRKLLGQTSSSDRLYIPLSSPVESPRVALPIDPYLLGAVLGDGHIGSDKLLFSSKDDFICQQVGSLLPEDLALVKRSEFNFAIVKKDARVRKGNNSLLTAFREMGLCGSYSFNKHIPALYMNSSISQRTAVLQGLMDTDGTVDKKTGSLSYCSTSRLLAAQVQTIVRSLGGLAKISKRSPVYTHDGEKKEGRTAYVVSIRLPDPSVAFRLPRKIAKLPVNYQYAECLRLRIKSVEWIGQKEAQCISVDHPDHLYITDDFVVTHNTYVATAWACEELLARRISKIIFTRPAVEAGEEKLGFLPGELEEKIAPWFEPLRQIMLLYFSEAHLENLMKRGRVKVVPMGYLRGLTFDNAVVILDEAQNTTPKQMKLLLTRIGQNCKVIINGDVDQKDIPGPSGLVDVINRLEGMEGVGRLQFTEDDIVRSGFVRAVLKRYRKMDDATAAIEARAASKPARASRSRTPKD